MTKLRGGDSHQDEKAEEGRGQERLVLGAEESLDQVLLRSRNILYQAIMQYSPEAVIGLFSGGNDSTVMVHAMRSMLTHAAHIVTGIGIPSTTEYVRSYCAVLDLPLIELETPAHVYRDILFAQSNGRPYGFPGPQGHNVCYWHLKQQRLRELRRRFVQRRRESVIFVTGIRATESSRRMHRGISVPIRREGSAIWVNPILWFGSLLMTQYRRRWNLPQSQASALLHRSGECLCGAFANKEELKEIEFWFPEVGAYIRTLENELNDAGAKNCEWGGQSADRAKVRRVPGQLCFGCMGFPKP